jgi:hypothetical protein
MRIADVDERSGVRHFLFHKEVTDFFGVVGLRILSQDTLDLLNVAWDSILILV